MARQICQICDHVIEAHDFATISPFGPVCSACWAEGRNPGAGAMRIDCVENPTQSLAMPEALALLALKAG